MGKWTPGYTDDVLHSKISALVTGAIRRSAEEEPRQLPISYTEFVNELDTGDSFTTTIVDILVKEVMERRKRQNTADRRYISERTAKSLRQLGATLNIYRGRPTRGWTLRRPHTVFGPEGGLIDTDDDDFDPPGLNSIEASHLRSSELFEALNNQPSSRLVEPTNAEDPSTGSTPPPLALRSPSTTARGGPWTFVPATTTATGSARSHPTLRRNIRTRTDFNEFARRHRNNMRAVAAAREAEPLDVVEEGWRYRATGGPSTRRFFAPDRPRNADAIRRQPSTFSEGTDASGDDDALTFINIEAPPIAGPSTAGSSSAAASAVGWTHGIGPPTEYWTISPRAIMSRGPESRADPPALRRGTVVAPETMFMVPPALTVPMSRSHETVESVLEQGGYPTPDSVENEHLT